MTSITVIEQLINQIPATNPTHILTKASAEDLSATLVQQLFSPEEHVK